MRIPKKPPESIADMWLAQASDRVLETLQKLQSDEVIAFVRKANRQYLHWDKVRHYPRPMDLTAREIWAGVQMSRVPMLQSIPLSFSDLNTPLRLWVPPRHTEWLHRIDQEAGGNIGGKSSLGVADGERYLYGSLMEEAIASSQLEGATTTREVAKRMLREKRKPRNRAERMIANNYNAILEIRDLRNEPLSPALICQIQSIITDGTLEYESCSGRFRTPADAPVVVEDSLTGDVIHTPPSVHTLEYRIEELCDFANTESEDFVHPAIKAIALHFALGYIHPFVDGNGRTARAIFYWYMLKHGYWIFEYLPISKVFLSAPVRYARAYLYTETDGGDLTYFNHYHLDVIVKAIDALHVYLSRQQHDLHEASQLVEAYPDLNYRQVAVICDSLKHSGLSLTLRQHAGKHKVTLATARNDLLALEELGLMHKELDGKKWIFSPVPHLVSQLRKKVTRAPT